AHDHPPFTNRRPENLCHEFGERSMNLKFYLWRKLPHLHIGERIQYEGSYLALLFLRNLLRVDDSLRLAGITITYQLAQAVEPEHELLMDIRAGLCVENQNALGPPRN